MRLLLVRRLGRIGRIIMLARLRLQIGDQEGASEIARHMSTERTTPSEKLELAHVLSSCGFPGLVEALRKRLDETESY